jgi:biopolymer transport protein ExbD
MASKKTPEINGGSMADISFLMLIFFLMVSTMDSEQGLSRRLPPMPDKNAKVEDIKVNRRNILEVKINSRDNIFAGSQYISDVSQLDQIVIDFLTNPTNSDKLSAKKDKEIEGSGTYHVPERVISLQIDRSTHYVVYLEVQNALVRAINTIRDDFSTQHFGKKYAALDADQQKIVRTAIPQNISEAEPKDVSKKK